MGLFVVSFLAYRRITYRQHSLRTRNLKGSRLYGWTFEAYHTMKIIFVTSSLGFGGAERVISELASEFSKQHQVLVAITSIKQKESYSCGSAAITYLSEASKLSPFQ